jgi:flagellin-like protein
MMKKMWKLRKDKSAVSPVIATILMVEITVVLAAVLYVMVMGFGGGNQSTITGSFTTSANQGTTEKLQFGVLTPDTAPNGINMRVEISGAATGSCVMTYAAGAWATAVSPGTLASVGLDGATKGLVYTDLAADNKISNGDYVTLLPTKGALASGAYTYTITMINPSSGAAINSISFSWTF